MTKIWMCFIYMTLGCTMHAQTDGFFTKKGDLFPRFEVTGTDGDVHTLASIKGKPSLILFFGTRCPPCLKEIRHLSQELDRDWRKKFNILVIGSTDTQEELVRFKEKHNYDFDFVPDSEQYMFHAVAKSRIPRSVLLDQDGVIRYQTYGYSPAKLEVVLSKLKRLM